MNQLFHSVPDSKFIPLVREARYKSLMSSSRRGVLIRVFICAVSLIAALFFNSAALFMDALSTGLDIISSLILMLSFKLANRPPDDDHPFGHGRYEPLAGLQVGLFLSGLGALMFFYNIFQINQYDQYTSIHPQLWLIPFVSVILLELTYRFLIRKAKENNSPALASDAIHYRIDSITSIFATVSLFLAGFSPQFSQMLDHSGASVIALFMVIVGINAARGNMNQLMDRIPEQGYFESIKKAAFLVNGVLGTAKIRMQLFGPDGHVDIDVEVDPHLQVKEAHDISEKVRLEIQKELPIVRDVTVHIEPFYDKKNEID